MHSAQRSRLGVNAAPMSGRWGLWLPLASGICVRCWRPPRLVLDDFSTPGVGLWYALGYSRQEGLKLQSAELRKGLVPQPHSRHLLMVFSPGLGADGPGPSGTWVLPPSDPEDQPVLCILKVPAVLPEPQAPDSTGSRQGGWGCGLICGVSVFRG